MTTTAKSRTYYGEALVCREETAEATTLRQSAMQSQLCERIEELTSNCFHSYVGFREWQAVVEAGWSSHPRRYSEKVQSEMDRISVLWFEIGKLVIPLMDWAEQQGKQLTTGKDFRKQYASMLAIESMDRGPMPAHMVEVTKDARATLESGTGLEAIGSGGF